MSSFIGAVHKKEEIIISNFDVYFNDYLLDLKIRRLDEKTIRNYKIDLNQFFNEKQIQLRKQR